MMAMTNVKEALVRIAGPGAAGKGEETRGYFCIEDTFPTKNIDVSVEGVGKLSFPLSQESINNMITVSTTAKFGRGEDTVEDTNVRNTQVISEKHLKVIIGDACLSNILERMCPGLNVDSNAYLVPYLYNLLIYGPGQFFKMHRDSEKMENMVATLVILLPSVHKGGELIIHHNNHRHVFFCSKYPEIVKCIVFYSDCEHEIKEVTDGYRVALTYNVVLKIREVADNVPVDEGLESAVLEYFDSDEEPEKLVYLLNHSYSEHSLKWDLLKGTDRSCAVALLAVAKRQGRIPCLALANHTETYGSFYEYESDSDSKLEGSSINLYFWVNGKSLPIKEMETFVSEDEVCYTQETREIFKPYKTEESGNLGNEGGTRDRWYRRACIVLWASKWVSSSGFKDAIMYLHSLTTSEGNEAIICNVIDDAGSTFYQKTMWTNAGVCDVMIAIARYINDSEKTVDILSNLPSELLNCENIDSFLELERHLNNKSWEKICNAWKTQLNWESTLNFIQAYAKQEEVSKSMIVGHLLEDCLGGFIKSTLPRVSLARYLSNTNYSMYNRYIYDKTTNIETTNHLCQLLGLLLVSNKQLLENKLIQHVISTPSVFTSQGLAEIYFKLKEDRPNECVRYKILSDTALLKVQQDLIELKNHGESWYWPIDVTCSCQLCVDVRSFFHSKNMKRAEITADDFNVAHAYDFLNQLQTQPITFDTKICGFSYKIVIDKSEKLLNDRRGLIKELTDIEKKLLDCTKLVDENNSLNDLATSSSSMNQSLNEDRNLSEECSNPYKRIKM